MSSVGFNHPQISSGIPNESTQTVDVKKGENKDVQQLSLEQKAHLKQESLKRTVRRVAITTGAVLLSPLILAAGGVLALSKMLSKENSLWDKAMSQAILPAASRSKAELAKKTNEGHPFFIESGDNSKIHVMVKPAKLGNSKLEPSIAAEMPCVVLFCQNNAAMEDPNMQQQAEEFQKKGYNVVMFNYRGVGQSKGMVRKCDDLYQDGKAVINKLIGKDKGFDIGNGVMLNPAISNVILDGSSIGGAVAIHIGADHPQAILVANRTFTKWTDAAEGLVAKFTNPLFAKMAKGILKQSKIGEFDNVAKLKTRLSDSNHSITIIESAGVTGDGVLTSKAQLTEAKLTENYMKAKINKELHQNRFINNNKNKVEDLRHHNSFIPLEERVSLSNSFVEPHFNSLQMLKNVIELNERINVLKLTDKKTSSNLISNRIKSVNDQIAILDKIVASNSKINEGTLGAIIDALTTAISKLQSVRNEDVGQIITKVETIKFMIEMRKLTNSI